MRLILLALTTLACAACGVPEVDAPQGNDQLTSDEPSQDLPPPEVKSTPKSYPYRKLVLSGTAYNGARVIVRGAGNPQVANVQPVQNSFCVVVDLATAPAQYTLTIESQAEDGRLSDPTEIVVNRSNDAPAPTDLKLCDGSPVN